MSKTTKQGKPAVPTSNYVSHYDPAKSDHRAWLSGESENWSGDKKRMSLDRHELDC